MENNEQAVTGQTNPVGTVTQPESTKVKPVAVEKQPDQSPGHVARERLLAMAKRYRKEGQVREAMEMFWELAESHSDTSQGDAAKELLLEMAAGYERDGSPRMARSIYERILDDED